MVVMMVLRLMLLLLLLLVLLSLLEEAPVKEVGVKAQSHRENQQRRRCRYRNYNL